jgi:hypothetical protein
MAQRMCEVDGCDNEISDGCGSKGGKPICTRCRAAQYSDKNLPAKALLAKRERWTYWENRMDYLHPNVQQMLAEAERKVRHVKKSSS